MNTIDDNLQQRLKRLADEVTPDARVEQVVLARAHVKRRLTAMMSGLVIVAMLIGGIAGASMLWQPKGTTPLPPADSDCDNPRHDVAIYVDDAATGAEIEGLRAELEADEEVEAAVFFSKKAAFEEFKQHYADQPEFWENLPEDALPMSFRVTLVDGANAKQAARRFKTLPQVEDVRADSAMRERWTNPGNGSTPTTECISEKGSQVRGLVRSFMKRRISGAGAERFLDAKGRLNFGPGGNLAPLYPDPPLEDFQIVFVDPVGEGSFEVGVSLVFQGGTYEETLSVQRRAGRMFISGGRPGMKGP